MPNYHKLSDDIQQKIMSDRASGVKNVLACSDDDIIRRNPLRDKASLWRPAFTRDCEKIIYSPYYNRYTDKTQVFSFHMNDDLSRRGLHVQLVSRVARNIGSLLGLNNDLIEAMALGHDMGHTPFGHAGERILDDLSQSEMGTFFNHNVNSITVLDKIFNTNISLQVLDGIMCHNGEFECSEYKPQRGKTFDDFDNEYNNCINEANYSLKLTPMTLEGCVVRISDIIAYLGRDRQDAIKAGVIGDYECFTDKSIGRENGEIINNLIVDIVENSYGKDCITMSDDVYESIRSAKSENYKFIYHNEFSEHEYDDKVRPMINELYSFLLTDFGKRQQESYISKYYLDFLRQNFGVKEYIEKAFDNDKQTVIDFIASMTDSYFLAVYNELIGGDTHKVDMVSYFD